MALRAALTLAALLLALPAAASAHGEDGVITHMDTREELAAVDVASTAAAAAVPGALPYRWCGDARTTDDTANAVLPPPPRASSSSTRTRPTAPTAPPLGVRRSRPTWR